MSDPLQQQNLTQNQKNILPGEFRRSLEMKLSLSPVLSRKTPISISKMETLETRSTDSSKEHSESSHTSQSSSPVKELSQSSEIATKISLEKSSPLVRDVPHKKRRVI
jgi:hypothetical protein